MAFSPLVIANFFTAKYGNKPHVVLQKLVYLAHGWYMALEGEPLIDEEPQAWKYGPVFPTLYNAVKSHQKIHGRKTFTLQIPEKVTKKSILDLKVISFLNAVHDRYGSLYAGQLTALTHRKGSPWYKVTSQYLDNDEDIPSGLTIPNSLIQEEYRNLTEKN